MTITLTDILDYDSIISKFRSENKNNENKNNENKNNENQDIIKYKLSKLTNKKNKEYNLIKYNKECLLEEDYESIGLFRSVVFKDGKLVSYSPGKSLKFDLTNISEEDKFHCEEFVDGTMINLFYDDDKWEITTKSCIKGNIYFFKDYKNNLTFRDMFFEILNIIDLNLEDIPKFDNNNNRYCYSFVIQHPANRIVTKVDKPKLYLTNIYKIIQDQENKIIKLESFKLNKSELCDEEINFKKIFDKSNLDYPNKYGENLNKYELEGIITDYAGNKTNYEIQV